MGEQYVLKIDTDKDEIEDTLTAVIGAVHQGWLESGKTATKFELTYSVKVIE